MDNTGRLFSTEQNSKFRRARRINCDLKPGVIRRQSSINNMHKNNLRAKHKCCFPPSQSKRTDNCRRTIVKLFFFLQCVSIFAGPDALAFNLDVYYPTVISIYEKNSYFGYSVEMFADSRDESWLLVGAPKSLGRGEVYKCPYEEGKNVTCSRVNIIQDISATDTQKDMFGMSMKIGQEKNLVACAPYFTQRTDVTVVGNKKITYYDMLGICYSVNDFSATEPGTLKLIPCQSEKGRRHDGDAHGTCQAGFSLAFTKDRKEMLLGTVGSYYRQGAIMLLDYPVTENVTFVPIHTREFDPHESEVPKEWQNRKDYIIQSYDNNYLGYNVATGRSFGDTQLLLASAPRRYGYDMYGMVVVYDINMEEPLYNFTGLQPGEYFGCGLAAVDLNNDNLDDVVIGAPLYSDFSLKQAENGRVYVYYQLQGDGKTLRFSEPVIINGTLNRARLGHVVSSIGDINLDGYNDIAVGAPYTSNIQGSRETNDGSIFIFNGGPEGLVVPASQEIKGMTFSNTMSGFGISIVGEKDVDRNGYPDVLTGAYISGHAVLLRSRPVLEVISTVSVSPQTIDIEAKTCSNPSSTSCFDLTTCFNYSGKSVPSSILLSYEYEIDTTYTGDEKRAFILDESPKNVTITKTEAVCVKETAHMTVDVRDKLSEIKVRVSHSLVEEDKPVQPILNQLKPAYSDTQVKIFKDCGTDDICQANLHLESTLDPPEIYVGNDWPVVLRSYVKNSGEPAFLTTFVVESPPHVSFVGLQDKQATNGFVHYCSTMDQFVSCELGNPMKRDTTVDLNLKFMVTRLMGNLSALDFKVFVNSTNKVNNTSNLVRAQLSVDVRSNIVVYGSSSPPAIFLENKNAKEGKQEMDDNTTSVIHTYELINNGPSDISSGTINIKWPLKTSNGKYLLEIVDIVETNSVICNSVSKMRQRREVSENDKNASSTTNVYHCESESECVAFSCSVDMLRANEKVTVSIESSLLLKTVLQNDLDSEIRSEFEFTIDSYPYPINLGPGPTTRGEITTNCVYVREPATKEVEWWIIALAVAAGVAVLVILIITLWKCGFFKRKRKPEGDDIAQRERLCAEQEGNEDEKEMENYLK